MKGSLAILTLALFTGLTALAVGPAQEVVKVSSRYCGIGELVFAGTGILFEESGHHYVLTSEHVLLHGNAGICHSVRNGAIGTRRAELKIADWGMGLALLEIPGTLPFRPRGLAEGLPERGIRAGEAVMMAGFPWESPSLFIDTHGSILQPGSSRHLMPSVASLIELEGAHGEFGMSGGPVYAEDGASVIGILSHQYLSLVPGQKTRVGELNQPLPVIANNLLVIPAPAVREWLIGYFADPERFLPGFVKDPAEQIERKEAVYAAGLRFEARASGATPVGGIGGAEGVGGLSGHGGAEGVGGLSGHGGAEGVGGQGTGSPAVSVHVTLDSGNHPTQWYLPALGDWVESLRGKALLPWNRLEIPYFLFRDEQTGAIEPIYFSSLTDFFHRLKNPKLEPVVLLHSQHEDGTAAVAALNAIGRRMAQHATALQSASDPIVPRLLVERLRLIGTLLAESWDRVRFSDLDQLTKDTAGWQYLFNHRFDPAEELYGDLTAAKEALRKLKL